MPLFREPTKEDKQKIKAINPNVDSFENIVIVSIAAIHTFKTRSAYAWSLATLEALAETYPGKAISIDHEWDDLPTIQGKIITADIQKPAEINPIYNPPNNNKANQVIQLYQGFYILMLEGYITIRKDLFETLKDHLISDNCISIGGHGYTQALCPLSGLPISHYSDGEIWDQMQCESPQCRHCAIHPWWPLTDDEIALLPNGTPMFDFYIRDCSDMEALEVSALMVPNVPGCGFTPV